MDSLMLLPLHSFVPLLAQSNPLEHVVDKPLFQTGGGFWILSNNIISLCISAIAMLVIFPLITRAYREGEHVPTGTRNFFEAMLIYIREDMVRPVLGEHTDRFISYLWTLFFFILFNNLLGLLPLDVLTGWFLEPLHRHGLGGTATANIWVTGALAIVAFIVIQVNGIRSNGLWGYLKHFTGGAPLYMIWIIVPLEIIGMFIKPFALAIRLFANMIAGHTVLAVMLMFSTMAFASGSAVIGWGVSVGVVAASVALMCLEVFVAFLQTYIFVFLVAMFMGQLMSHEHDSEHDHAEAASHGAPQAGKGDDFPDNPRQAAMHMAG